MLIGRTERTARTAVKAGATEVLIVLGARAEAAREALEHRLSGLLVRWIVNQNWQAGNGTSILAAQPFVGREERFLVLMADHLLFAPTLCRLMAAGAQGPTCVLRVDKKIASVIDVGDATKGRLEGKRVVELHKALAIYDALDIGAAVCGAAFFDALREAAQKQQGSCSHSDGMRGLVRKNLLSSFEIGEDHWETWIPPKLIRPPSAFCLIPCASLPMASCPGIWNTISLLLLPDSLCIRKLRLTW